VRSQWIQKERANPSSFITVRFALTQYNLDVLENTLLDISNVHSENYGKWWTAKDITELVAPSKDVSSKVASFLKNAGATKVEDLRDVIKVTAKVSFIESLLQTTLFNFQHVERSRIITKAVGSYAIPTEIAEHVDFVAGLYEFPSVKASHTAAVGDNFDGFIVPATINNLYGITSGITISPNSTICLVEFQDDQSYNKKDLKDFTTQNDLPEIKVVKVVGPYSGTDPDAESTLDIQYGGAIAQGTGVWFWTVADWMYDFATDFLATPNPPLVVSMSWGWPEPKQCDVGNCTNDETSKQYVERTNVEFQKIGAIGVSLFAASGDQGAPGDGNPDCSASGSKALSTIFPGASPWVVSVGATQLSNSTANVTGTVPPICKQFQCASSTTEEVCSYPAALITTGGGFSDYVATPSYQADAVAAYLKSGVALPPSKDFNAKNRGFPDVSALGHNYLIADGGEFEQVDGTSCSSPVFAAVVALLNSYRLTNGKPPLGFVVPLLYQAYASDPTIFNDITTGDNKCTESCCAKVGYEATKGWDPVTGLGTPNFAKLLAFVKTLP
jgi:subtilase family serine protease